MSLFMVPVQVRAQCDELKGYSVNSIEDLIEFVTTNEAEMMTCLDLDSFNMFSFKKFLISYPIQLNAGMDEKADEQSFVVDSAYHAFDTRILQNRMYHILRMMDEPKMRVINLPLSVPEKRLRNIFAKARFNTEETEAFVSYWKKHRSEHKNMEELYSAFNNYQQEQKVLAEERRKEVLVKDWGLTTMEDLSVLHDIPFFEKLKPAQACARAMDRPMIICFSGYTVVNSRKMEDNVLVDTNIQQLLREDYIFVLLMVDDKRELPKEEQRTEIFKGESFELKTYGDQWAFLELKVVNSNRQPFFVKTNAELVRIGSTIQYTSSIPEFKSWLGE